MPSSILERSLKLSVIDGIAYCFMVGVAETFIPAFALAVGVTEADAGFIAVGPVLIGAIFQLLSPVIIQKFGSPKRWVITAAALQALAQIPLVILPLKGEATFNLIFAAAAIYWCGGMGAASGWNLWMAKLVPSPVRRRYFNMRSRACHLAVLVGMGFGGVIAERSKLWGDPLKGFALMFTLGLLARTVCVICLHLQHEPEDVLQDQKFLSTIRAWKELLSGQDTRILKYVLLITLFLNLSGPLFAPYMLSELGMNYEVYMVLICTTLLARALILPVLNLFHKRLTATRLLKIGGVLIVASPMWWAFSDNFLYLVWAQIYGGIAWGIFELGMTLCFFDSIKSQYRTSLLTQFNLANALMMTIGGYIGAQILHHLGSDKGDYHAIFIASGTLRLLALWFLIGTKNIPGHMRPVVYKVFAAFPFKMGTQQPLKGS